MTEFTFSTGAKSAAGVKVILTSGSGINAGKFISEEEAAALRAAVRKQKFDGKAGTFAEIFNGKTRIVAAGTGARPNALDLQILGGKLYKKISGEETAAVFIPADKKNPLSAGETAAGIALGIELGGYRFDKYFTKKPADSYPKLEKVEFLSETQIDDKEFADNPAMPATSATNRPTTSRRKFTPPTSNVWIISASTSPFSTKPSSMTSAWTCCCRLPKVRSIPRGWPCCNGKAKKTPKNSTSVWSAKESLSIPAAFP